MHCVCPTAFAAVVWVEGELSSDERCARSPQLHEEHQVRLGPVGGGGGRWGREGEMRWGRDGTVCSGDETITSRRSSYVLCVFTADGAADVTDEQIHMYSICGRASPRR